MKNVTLIIQGRVSQETLDFYTHNYPSLNVIISTWIENNLNLNNLPPSYKLICQPLPEKGGHQNQNYQFASTINGLYLSNTEYVIKIRGDEYYNNIEYILSQMERNPNKVFSSPIFFRHWSFMKYHISDHVIAGTRENLLMMFQSAIDKIANGELYHIRNGEKLEYWEPEINLTRAYLMDKEPDRYEVVDGRILMIDNFEILDINKMTPYKIVANIFKTTWKGGFIPERNYSISNVRKLLLSKEKAYDTDIT
jgi:hypothetical protein